MTHDFYIASSLLWSRWRFWIVLLSSLALLGSFSFYLLFQPISDGDSFIKFLVGLIVISLQAPLVLFAIFALDWNHHRIEGGESSVEPFVLRAPIPTWSLAATPLLFKTLIICLAIGIPSLLEFATSSGPSFSRSRDFYSFYLSGFLKDFSPPFLIMSNIAIWVSGILWRPCASSSRRLMMAACAATALIAGGVLAHQWIDPFLTFQKIRSGSLYLQLDADFCLFVIIMAVEIIVGLLFAASSLRLARVHSAGYLPARAVPTRRPKTLSTSTGSNETQIRSGRGLSFLSWLATDPDKVQRRQREELWWMFSPAHYPSPMIVLAVAITVFMLVILPAPVNLMCATFLAAIWGAALGAIPNENNPGQRKLPLLLAISPIPIITIASVRIRRTIFSGCVIAAWVFILRWTLIAIFYLWNGSQPSFPSWQISLLSIVLAMAVIITRSLANLWWQLSSNRTLEKIVGALGIIVFVGPLLWFVTWTIDQNDYELFQESISKTIGRTPDLLLIALFVKLAFVSLAMFASWKVEPTTPRWITKVCLLWVACFAALTAICWPLIPAELKLAPEIRGNTHFALRHWQASFFQCAAVIALLIPLARIVGLPQIIAHDVSK